MMYKRKIKLTRFMLFYSDGSTREVYYPGSISGKQLIARLAIDPCVLICDKEDGRYIAVQPSRKGLEAAVVIGFRKVMTETDPIKLVCFSKQITCLLDPAVENEHNKGREVR